MLKKLLSSCLVLLFILPLVVSCSVANASETTLIPGAANTVVKIQVDKILSNPALQVAYSEIAKTNAAWPQNTNEALNQLLQKTGFDLSTISNLVLFADIESANQTQNTYIGVIGSGTFNEVTFTDNIQQQTKQTMTTSEYKGLKIYSGEKDQFELVFLSQSQLVFGTPKAVRDVIDVSKGDRPALSGGVIDTLNRFSSALVVGASTAPQSLHTELSQQLSKQTTFSLKSFQDMDTIGFAIDQPSLSLSIRIDVHFLSVTSVQDSKDAITGLISLAKGASQDQNVKTALSNIQVSTTDSWLSVRDLVSPADLATLIGLIQAKK